MYPVYYNYTACSPIITLSIEDAIFENQILEVPCVFKDHTFLA